MFTPRNVQELQLYTNLLQQVINHPQSFTKFDVAEQPGLAAHDMADLADLLTEQWTIRHDAFEKHVNAPKVAVAGPMDAARMTNPDPYRIGN